MTNVNETMLPNKWPG